MKHDVLILEVSEELTTVICCRFDEKDLTVVIDLRKVYFPLADIVILCAAAMIVLLPGLNMGEYFIILAKEIKVGAVPNSQLMPEQKKKDLAIYRIYKYAAQNNLRQW